MVTASCALYLIHNVIIIMLLLSLPSLLLLLLLGPGSGGAAIPVNAQPDLQLRP